MKQDDQNPKLALQNDVPNNIEWSKIEPIDAATSIAL